MTEPRFTEHDRLMWLVKQLSPETRARLAGRLDDRFHEITGAPRADDCCGPVDDGEDES